MRASSALFDPHGLLNPGQDRRRAADDRAPARPGAAAGAAARHAALASPSTAGCAARPTAACGSARAARPGAGVMCPSYMATRDEEHATRGRANALVRALSQPDPQAALGDERLHEILDLCLECKACKTECPLVVDMAALKSEFLSHYQDVARRAPALARCSARSARSTASARRCAAVELRPRLRRCARLLERTLGIARRRPLPRFERETLVRWDRRRRAPAAAAPRGRRLPRRLLHDVHRAGHRPRRDRAARGAPATRAPGARRLLRAREHLQGPARPGARHGRRDGRPARPGGASAACRSSAASPRACSRCATSTSPAAGRPARRRPSPARRGSWTSCWRRRSTTGALRLDPRRLERAAHPLPRPLPPEGAASARRRPLRCCERIPGAEVEELDAGCCGMAGSFGFEASTTTSRCRSAESRLFPALRAAPRTRSSPPPASPAASRSATGRAARPRHPVQLARAALRSVQSDPGGVECMSDMSSISIIVLIASSSWSRSTIGRPATWACSGIVAAFAGRARRSAVHRGRHLRRLPGRPVRDPRRGDTTCSRSPTDNGTVDWLVACGGASGRAAARRADPVGACSA